MIQYEKSDVISWLLRHFAIEKITGDEVNFPCPFCDHRSFYFNSAKRLGFCHHDQCHRKVNLDDLVDLIGSEPEPFSGYTPIREAPKELIDVELPPTARNVIDNNDLWVMEVLKHRHVDAESIKRFNIHSNYHMIFVPVYLGGQLVQYVGRSVDRTLSTDQGFTKTGKRYLYHTGVSITDYFLGWDECRLWKELVLVENTFNSMWLRDQFHCTTNFGSYLSKEQIKKLTHSNVKSVVLLWDEGAHLRSESAVRALKKAGIRAISIKIKGQPDNHHVDFLKAIIEQARSVVLSNPEVNFI